MLGRGCRGGIAETLAKRASAPGSPHDRALLRLLRVSALIDIALRVGGGHLSIGRGRRPRDGVSRRFVRAERIIRRPGRPLAAWSDQSLYMPGLREDVSQN